jgi:hypothetical protein
MGEILGPSGAASPAPPKTTLTGTPGPKQVSPSALTGDADG